MIGWVALGVAALLGFAHVGLKAAALQNSGDYDAPEQPIETPRLRVLAPLALAAGMCWRVVTWEIWWPFKIYAAGVIVIMVIGALVHRSLGRKWDGDEDGWLPVVALAWPIALVIGLIWVAFAATGSILKWLWESLAES